MSVYKKSNGSWYCRFQIDGERHHYLCNGAKTQQEAKKIEDGFRYRIQQQQNGVIPKENKENTFKFLCDFYLQYSRANKKSYKQDKSRVALISTYFNKYKFISDIKPNDIEKFKIYLLNENKGKTTINRYLEILSKMFNIAIDNEWTNKNPIKRNSKFPIKNYTVRYLKKDEEERMFKVCPDYFKPILILALQTGLRKTNIRLLKWSNIDMNFRMIEITENKGNKHIKIYMNDLLYKTFKELPRLDEEYVFINPVTNKFYGDTSFSQEWNKIRKNAGIEDFRFHDLRHTVGTRLAEKNVPVPVIKDLLAHSDVKTTMRYVHTATMEMQKAMDILNSYN